MNDQNPHDIRARQDRAEFLINEAKRAEETINLATEQALGLIEAARIEAERVLETARKAALDVLATARKEAERVLEAARRYKD